MSTNPPLTGDVPGHLATPATAAAETALWAAHSPPSGTAVLVVTRTVGRHAHSDVFLDEITVGRRDAELPRDNGQVQLIDSDSLNGTYVNGYPVESAVLAHGYQIQIGEFRLVSLTGPKAR